MTRAGSRLLLIATAFILLSSCKNKAAGTSGASTTADSTKAAKADTTAAAAPEAAAKINDKLNDIALYLAGMKPKNTETIPASLQNLSYYKLYSDSMDRGFNHIEDIRLGKMRAWAKTELSDELAPLVLNFEEPLFEFRQRKEGFSFMEMDSLRGF